MTTFTRKIHAFNQMYGLPVSPVPVLPALIQGVSPMQRLNDLGVILSKELGEIGEVREILLHARKHHPVPADREGQLDVLVALADLLGDIQVYCASEMAKFGLPNEMVLSIIMESNMSKLGADGLPILDATGKVQKGPNYWKPEPRIRALLAGLMTTEGMIAAVAEDSNNSPRMITPGNYPYTVS
jgi:hypothetical protein